MTENTDRQRHTNERRPRQTMRLEDQIHRARGLIESPPELLELERAAYSGEPPPEQAERVSPTAA